MHPNNIIDQLKGMDLSCYPEQQVYSLLHSLRMVGVLETTLFEGNCVYKCRPGHGYRSWDDFKYAPIEKCKKAQRASLRNDTILYCVIGEPENETTSAEYVGMCECSSLLWEENVSREKENISFSRWVVTEKLRLASIIHEAYFPSVPNPLLNEIKCNYRRKRINIRGFDDIQRFICSEFAKPVGKNEDYQYLISAMYTKILTSEFGFDGVLYPSVKAEGRVGLNVAICREAVDAHKIEMVKIFEADAYRYQKKMEVVNKRYIEYPSLSVKEDMIDDKIIWNRLIK